MTNKFLIAAAITFAGLINAQTVDSKFKFGAKAGYSLSTMKFFDNKLDSKSYFYAGLMGEQPVSSKVGIQAEVLYTQIGGKQNVPFVQIIDTNIQTLNSEFDYQLTQIQVPISVKYYFVPKFSASAGMNLAFNISEKVKTEEVINGNDSQNYDGVKSLNLFPFLGAEYKINDKFFVDARYNFNFIKINDGNLPTKIGFLQAGVGYVFN